MKKTKAKLLKTCLIVAGILFIAGCEPGENLTTDNGLPGSFHPGVFIINEGNYGGGNGSVSYFDFTELKVYDHLFQKANDRVLGDVPQSMFIIDSLGFIVVNNSGKIEVVNMDNFRSVNTITGLTSPRYFLPVSESNAYVSDLYSGSITQVCLDDFTVTKIIKTEMSTEQMIKIGNEVFVANWMGGNKILVINPIIGEIIDSIEVIIEPNSMVMDKNQKLWVLCSGGYLKEMPAILRIDPATREKEKIFRYLPEGALKDSFDVDIIPGSFVFNR